MGFSNWPSFLTLNQSLKILLNKHLCSGLSKVLLSDKTLFLFACYKTFLLDKMSISIHLCFCWYRLGATLWFWCVCWELHWASKACLCLSLTLSPTARLLVQIKGKDDVFRSKEWATLSVQSAVAGSMPWVLVEPRPWEHDQKKNGYVGFVPLLIDVGTKNLLLRPCDCLCTLTRNSQGHGWVELRS